MFSFQFEGKTYGYPDSLSEITLGQKILLYNEVGKEIEERAKEIAEMQEGFEQEMAASDLMVFIATQSFSFFTGIPIKDCQRIDLNHILNVTASCQQVLSEQEASLPEGPFAFKGEMWTIAPPELDSESKMTFNEFLVSKEVVRQLQSLGEGTWPSLIYLSCVYLRKEGETFTDILAKEDGERYKMMQELPLDIALAVAFFLSSSIHSFKKTLASSSPESQKAQTWPNSSTDGDGSPS